MLELIVMACLAKDPTHCREHNLTLLTPGLSPSQCLYSSIPRVSRWQVMNEAWQVRSWRCAMITTEEST
ncbi:hypothetical protein [Marinibacterium profundimaris]|uniref:Uncharacterized protein n=1 Tax=Marinibacterium profundimaris TaxID=1679460 RepID=A0A225NT16_9RHOB|nr:hypothetical protein [Marinibacterium profundimaris]OWU74750.1 hypothetical protein ATO3_09065 [Marinibacterium profundimaris]